MHFYHIILVETENGITINEQTMASQLRITNARMQQLQKQLNLQKKKMSNFENEKKQMEIDHLKALLAIKQGSSDVVSVNSLNKGSVRARKVGHVLY